jgi:hypothetical protein
VAGLLEVAPASADGVLIEALVRPDEVARNFTSVCGWFAEVKSASVSADEVAINCIGGVMGPLKMIGKHQQHCKSCISERIDFERV